MSASAATRVDPELPAVDERLVAPETRYEIYDGELVHVSPANFPHSRRHSMIAALLEAHAASRFTVVSDMLTRTTETSDIAPDVSVLPVAADPKTGGRQLEHLAFEVVSTESMSHASNKAAMLVARGVRRVFAIDVKRARALEWSRSRARWIVLDTSAHIKDRTLGAPLPIKVLLHAAKADDVMARALAAKRNPVIEALKAESKRKGLMEGERKGLAKGKRQGLAEGERKGLVKAVLGILTARGISLKAAARARILAEREPGRLGRWIARAATCTNTTELFVEP